MSAGTIRFSPLVRYVTNARGGAVRGALAQGRRPAGGSHRYRVVRQGHEGQAAPRDPRPGRRRARIPDRGDRAADAASRAGDRCRATRAFIAGEQVGARRIILDENDKATKEEGKQPADLRAHAARHHQGVPLHRFRSSRRLRSRRRPACSRTAIMGKRDDLRGLKENVIVGRLIPAGTGLSRTTTRARSRSCWGRTLDSCSRARSRRPSPRPRRRQPRRYRPTRPDAAIAARSQRAGGHPPALLSISPRRLVDPCDQQRVADGQHHGPDEDAEQAERHETADDAGEDQQQRQIRALLDQERTQEIVERARRTASTRAAACPTGCRRSSTSRPSPARAPASARPGRGTGAAWVNEAPRAD